MDLSEDKATEIGQSITVITPTIEGREEKLEECKASVEAQTIPVFQHLVMLDQFKLGPAATRNLLLGFVKTDFVLFLDDDDLLDPDYVEDVAPHLEENDVVYTWSRCDHDLKIDMDFNPKLLLTRNFIPVTACARTGFVLDVGGFPEDTLTEDWGLWLKMFHAEARFYCTCERKWTYRRSLDGRNLSS